MACREIGRPYLEDSMNERLYNVDVYSDDWNPMFLQDVFRDSPDGFEDFCGQLLQDMGYSVTLTRTRQDGGYDIDARQNGRRFLVECKCYAQHNHVTRPLVQRLVGVNATEHADGLIFMTTSRFSQGAVQYALQTGVILIDGSELIRLTRSHLVF